MQFIQNNNHIFRTEESEKLTAITLTKEIVKEDIDRLKKIKSPGPNEIYQKLFNECKEIASEPLAEAFIMSLCSVNIPLP